MKPHTIVMNPDDVDDPVALDGVARAVRAREDEADEHLPEPTTALGPQGEREPTEYEMAILHGLQGKDVYQGTVDPVVVAHRRRRNRAARRSRRTNRLAGALLIATSAFIGAAFYFASPARADTVGQYATTHAGAVCGTLAAYPSFDGITGIGLAMMNNDGLTPQQAAYVLITDVAVYCPQYSGLVHSYADARGTSGKGAVV